jgi:hypothetical protein
LKVNLARPREERGFGGNRGGGFGGGRHGSEGNYNRGGGKNRRGQRRY